MKKAGVYAYYIPTSDFHASEYTNDHFKVREFFSGFTGSAGDLLVTRREALLWTDGRYFIQAERELEGTGITLMKTGEEGVDNLEGYLSKNLPKDAVLGFDGRTVSYSLGRRLKKAVPSHKLSFKKDLTSGIFDRPPFPSSDIRVLGDKISGQESCEKIDRLRKGLARLSCDGIFISKLDEIAYLFNIRAGDVQYTPVAMAYAYITADKAYIFLNDDKADTDYDGAIVKRYDEVTGFLKSGNVSGRVLIDPDSVSYRMARLIKKKAEICCALSPVEDMKAVKNETEISNIRKVYKGDSLALTRFIRWITTTESEETEVSAAAKLLGFRKKIKGFREPSFETISAYGDNAAIIHYEPSADRDRTIEKKGLYMVDSGGQYEGGTTDVTRTIVMGELTDEEKEAFTLTACGMLAILYTRFPCGTSGESLDVLARRRFWQKGLDFKHGTGHGVGYMLSVHEGPQAIRNRILRKPAELRPGMLISDEPGLYREGRFGVRTENILLVMRDEKTEDGSFLKFESLTMVPIDDRGMLRELMSPEEIDMYERYQKEVYETLREDLTDDERVWLKEYCGIR